MEAIKNTFRSNSQRVSGGNTPRTSHASNEDAPIHSDDPHVEIDVPDPPDHVDPATLSREPSVKFWQAPNSGPDSTRPGGGDSSSPRMSGEGESSARKQSNSGGEVSLTVDVGTDHEIGSGRGRKESADATHVSFEQPVQSEIRSETPTIWKSNSPGFDDGKSAGTNDSGDDDDDDDGEVVRCTSNRSYMRTPSMMRTKGRSRLLDPVNHDKNSNNNNNNNNNSKDVKKSSRMSGRMPGKSNATGSSPFFSGMMGKQTGEMDEEDDTEDDLPQELRHNKTSIIIIVEWTILILLMAALIATLSIPGLREKYILRLKLWKWLVTLLVFVCGRLVSSWGTKVIVFLIERNFVLRKRLLYFIYGIRSAVQNCLWLAMVLITWCSLLNKRVEKEVPNAKNLKYVTKVLVCLLVGTALWLVKTLIIKVLASSFHVSTYFDRIRETLFSQFVIETLSGPPVEEMDRTAEEEKKMEAEIKTLEDAGATVPQDLKEAAGVNQQQQQQQQQQGKNNSPMRGSNYNNGGISLDNLQKLNSQNISAWKMKRLMKVVRQGLFSTLDEQTVDATMYEEDEKSMMIRSEKEAKAVAKKIFGNVAKPGARYIELTDLIRFMSEDEAIHTVCVIGAASDQVQQRISKSCLKNWLVNAFRDRKALTLTLNDTKTVVNKLHRMVKGVIGIVVVVIWLLILEIATIKFILFMMSELVLLAFMFGNTAKMVFESIVFLFIMHPFDVGDRCEIDGVQMIVEEMNILNTVFLRYDNQKVIFPNSTLSTRPIGNYYRSPDMGDGIEFFVHMATPVEKIALMKHKIISYIEAKKEHWAAQPMVITTNFEDLCRVRMAVWLCHTINHQDMGEKFARRGVLMEEMIKIFKELDIQYRFLPLDINVRSLPPASTSRLPPTWIQHPH